MIKVQDFAHSKGVKDKAIYKHINKHRDELGEHVQKKGNNGTWLDDYACEYISSLMISNPIVLGDSQQQQEIERLKAENVKLKNKVIDLQDRMLIMSEQLQLSSSAQLLLEDRNKQLDDLKADHDELKKELEVLKNKKWYQFWK